MTEVARFQRFDSHGVSPVERFEYWRTWYSEAVDTPMRLEPVGQLWRDFSASAEVLTAGQTNLVDVHCDTALGVWSREGMEGPDLVRLAVFHKAPRVTLNWHGHEQQLADGAPALFGRTGGWWHAPRGFEAVFVAVPRASLALDDTVVDTITARQQPQRSAVFTTLVRPMLLNVVRRLRDLSTVPAADLDAVWRSTLTMLMRSLDGAPIDGADLAPARLHAVRRFVAQHLADPALDADAVAAAMHTSRRSLYQLVSGSGEEGVAALIRRHRLERARAILADPAHRHLPIAAVAAAVGLPNAAHFSRLFRAAYGETPRDVRARGALSIVGARA